MARVELRWWFRPACYDESGRGVSARLRWQKRQLFRLRGSTHWQKSQNLSAAVDAVIVVIGASMVWTPWVLGAAIVPQRSQR